MKEKIAQLLYRHAKTIHWTEQLDPINGIPWRSLEKVAEELHELFEKEKQCITTSPTVTK